MPQKRYAIRPERAKGRKRKTSCACWLQSGRGMALMAGSRRDMRGNRSRGGEDEGEKRGGEASRLFRSGPVWVATVLGAACMLAVLAMPAVSSKKNWSCPLPSTAERLTPCRNRGSVLELILNPKCQGCPSCDQPSRLDVWCMVALTLSVGSRIPSMIITGLGASVSQVAALGVISVLSRPHAGRKGDLGSCPEGMEMPVPGQGGVL